MIEIYCDGACQGNPGPGGWAAILVQDGQHQELKGREGNTTNNRMELTAAIKALEETPTGAEVRLHSDSQYLVYTMTRGWKRKVNLDLWQRLDDLVRGRKVRWLWLQDDHPLMQQAHRLANEMAGLKQETPQLTHLDASGQARMVDITPKPETEREAVARGLVQMKPETLKLLQQNALPKGDALAAARLAGIMAAKRTPDLIPLCHPLLITEVAVDLALDEKRSAVEITARARTTGKTGVEMEALVAVAVAALTLYDMCKAVEPGIRIGDIRLVRKTGGKSGTLSLEDYRPARPDSPHDSV